MSDSSVTAGRRPLRIVEPTTSAEQQVFGAAAASYWDAHPARRRELVVVGLLVALFDLVVFRGQGFFGLAAGFVLAPLFLWIGAPRRALLAPSLIVSAMLLVLALRMAWLGGEAQVVVGLALVAAFAMALSGRVPYLLDSLGLALQLLICGRFRLAGYARLRPPAIGRASRELGLRVVLPAAVVLLFALLFVQANPDLRSWVSRQWDTLWLNLERLVGDFVPTPIECLLWCLVAWTSLGLLRPILLPRALGWLRANTQLPAPRKNTAPATDMFPTVRNTLVGVSLLFTTYLVFEFRTLWFREFPQGFYYAGYAHEGAAWLTVALALATLVLSAIFRGRLLTDERLPRLKRLAWIWSALNILLAIAVYHRLRIYVDFNGMTRMRTVGLVGATTVLAGFLLVVWKIARDHDFLWLVERQLWALAVGLYVLAVLPTDALIHRHNVRRILAGDLAPSVQLTEHELDISGLAALTPLLDCDDPVIRDGVAARLATEWLVRVRPEGSAPKHWTARQLAERDFFRRLEPLLSRLDLEQPQATRDRAWTRFRNYAYQWY